MPIKKKTIESPAAAEIAAPKPRKPSTRTKKVESPAAEAAPELKARKKPAAGTPAATHKVPARKTVVRKSPAKPGPFDVEAHRAEIEREAYLQWLGRGAGHGSAGEDWFNAIEIVKARLG